MLLKDFYETDLGKYILKDWENIECVASEWDAKGENINEVYREACFADFRKKHPDFNTRELDDLDTDTEVDLAAGQIFIRKLILIFDREVLENAAV